MWVLCVVSGKKGLLEEMGEGERFIRNLESEVKEGKKSVCTLCVILMEDG